MRLLSFGVDIKQS